MFNISLASNARNFSKN